MSLCSNVRFKNISCYCSFDFMNIMVPMHLIETALQFGIIGTSVYCSMDEHCGLIARDVIHRLCYYCVIC